MAEGDVVHGGGRYRSVVGAAQYRRPVSERPVVLPTCLVEHVRPSLAPATCQLTSGEASAGTCCGQPAWNAGFASAARRVARRAVRRLRRTRGPIVVPSGSCATMIHEHWPHLFAGDRYERDARAVAERVQELAVYLDRHAEPGPPAAPTGQRVGYHDACHALRELGVKDEPRRLLALRGVEVVETAGGERCCGFGGTFSVKLPSVSVAMADDKLDEWVAAGVSTVVTGDLSCMMHLEGRARRRGLPLSFRHLAEVLRG
jgi:L-lactate dehydrogenase complex protein LldE